MGWDLALAATATYAKPEQFETFRRHIDAPWIEEALLATGTATVRRRRLPGEEVVWVVLGMALFRDRPIEDVVSKVDLALPGGGGTIARSSKRIYPRAVKIKMSNYDRKRPRVETVKQ